MKTSLLALSIVAAFPVAATAQSNSILPNTTVFGVLDMGIVSEIGGPSGSVNKLTTGIASGSRFGVKADKDIGQGLSAYAMLEGGLLADTGASGQGGLLFGRQAFVGLKGALGSVSLGRQYTPAAMIQVEMDPFTTGLAGTSANLLSPGGSGGSNRMNNTIKYNTPTGVNGFNAEVAYAFGEVAGNNAASSEYGANLGYANGPVSVKFGYHNVNDATGIGGDVTWLAGKYDFGILTGYLNLVSNKGSKVFGVLNTDSTDVLIGFSAPLAGGKFMASYISKRDNTSANLNTANQFAIGYDYFLDKSVDLYVSAAHIDNGNTPIIVGTSGYRVGNATEQGSGNGAFNFGVRYSF